MSRLFEGRVASSCVMSCPVKICPDSVSVRGVFRGLRCVSVILNAYSVEVVVIDGILDVSYHVKS